VLGGHLSANVAVEAALLAPHRVPAIVLDGVYASTPEENAVLLAPYATLSPRWSADGSHRSFPWAISEICLSEWNPRFRPGPDTLAETYAVLADYLQMGHAAISAWIEPEGPPPPPYDVLGRIAKLEVPVLVLGAQEEALRPCFDRALLAARRGHGHEFPGNHPLFVPARAGEYAGIVSAFARENLG
jgi:pimeloyl-ACP methyl ester carboxylesterase